MTTRHPSQYPTENEVSQPAILKEFIRRHKIMMNRDGDPSDVTIFIRKSSQSTGATKCPTCWDEHGQSSARSDCSQCFGTGYLGGFDKVMAKVRVLTATRLITLEELGLVLSYQPQAWIAGAEPKVSNGDVLVRENNFRYEVMDYTPQETQGVITRQVFTLKFLPPAENSALYSLT